jgi:environmental stress-induced protein Ves
LDVAHVNRVLLSDCGFVPWRNGGGRTRELLAWPRADDWLVRVSVAEIEADGPFSPFPGIDRCFAVLDGAGVELTLPASKVRLGPADDAWAFPGEAAPGCRLIDGPTRDLNLMARRDAGRISMQRRPVAAGAARWRGLFADDTLWWTDDPTEALPAHGSGWWLTLETR